MDNQNHGLLAQLFNHFHYATPRNTIFQYVKEIKEKIFGDYKWKVKIKRGAWNDRHYIAATDSKLVCTAAAAAKSL